MKISVRNVGKVTIIDPNGKITVGVGDVAFRDSVSKCLKAGDKNMLVNFSGVSSIDSSGIGELVGAHTTVSNSGGKFKLCNLSPTINDLLKLTQLISIFEVFDNEEEAISSF